jgi:hypothetical protein
MEEIKKFNRKITNYKEKRGISEQLLNELTIEKAKIPKPKIITDFTRSKENLLKLITDIEYNIAVLNEKIEKSVLDINEENYIIEKINTLEKQKQLKLNKVKDLEQKIVKELEHNDYYTIKDLIKNLQERVKDFDNLLFQMFENRLLKHKEFMDLYKKIKAYEFLKKELENDFNKIITSLEYYNDSFKEIKNYDKSILFKDIYSKLIPKELPSIEITSKKEKSIIKKKRLLKKLKNEKLKEALDKQKAGQKLDFYELKLIMDQLKKEK